MTRYYRISLGRGAKDFPDAWDKGYIGVGWLATIDLTGKLPDAWREFNREYIQQCKEIDGIESNIGAGLACGQTWVACRGASRDDVVLSPNGQGQYAVGRVVGDYEYVPGTVLCHRRRVSWFPEMIERTSMSEGLRRSLQFAGTVQTIDGFDEELEQLVSGYHPEIHVDNPDVEDPISFALEKHLEDFLESNWASTELGKWYEIYTENGEAKGRRTKPTSARLTSSR